MAYIGNKVIQPTVVYYEDTDVSSASWVVDEDTMSSNTATKVSTQQASKAYIDSTTTTGDNNSVADLISNADRVMFVVDAYRKGGTEFPIPSTSTDTLITFSNTEIETSLDSHSAFQANTGTFTPPKSGKYLVWAGITWDKPGGAGRDIRLSIYKNGSAVSYGGHTYPEHSSQDNQILPIRGNWIIDMNGTTDYIQLYGYRSADDNDFFDIIFGAVRLNSDS